MKKYSKPYIMCVAIEEQEALLNISGVHNEAGDGQQLGKTFNAFWDEDFEYNDFEDKDFGYNRFGYNDFGYKVDNMKQ